MNSCGIILILSAFLFCTGLFGLLTQRILLKLFVAVELMMFGIVGILSAAICMPNHDTASGLIFITVAIIFTAINILAGYALVILLHKNSIIPIEDKMDLFKW